MAESYVSVNGVRHWLRTSGDLAGATPLVIVHGGPGGTIYDFERLTGPGLEQLVHVVYYEQRGCGRSDQPADRAYSIPLLVDDLERLRSHLGLARMTLLGISFGGDLAAEYTVAYPERVDRLILHGTALAGPLTPSTWGAGFEAVAADDEMRDAIRAAVLSRGPDGAWDVVDQATTDRFLFHQPGSARKVRDLWAESGVTNTGEMRAALAEQPPRPVPLADQLAALKVPVLVLVGLWDRNCGVDACRDLATRLPHAQLRVFAESAHFPNVEEPERYLREVAAFLGIMPDALKGWTSALYMPELDIMSGARGGSVLIGALIVDSLGNGLFLPLSMVFFLKLTAVSLGVLGVLASAATVVTLPVPVWTGTLTDRFGAIPLVVTAQIMQAIGYLAFGWVKTPAGIFAVSALVAVGVRVFWSAIFTAIADYADAGQGQRSKDSWYALANTARTAGLAVGGLVAGAVVADGKVAAYLAIAYCASASFVAAATLIAFFVRAPRLRGHDSPAGQGYREMLTDRPFLGLIAVNTVFAMSSLMLPLALPAFVLRGLHEPGWLTASVLAGNAILISVLGAPVTKLVRHYRRTRILAASAVLWASWTFLFALLVPGHPAWVIPLLIGATLLFTVADVMHAPASAALAAAAAPDHVRGRYLAVFQYSWTFASIAGPVFFTSLFGIGRATPWIVLGLVDCASAVAIVALERRLPDRALRADRALVEVPSA